MPLAVVEYLKKHPLEQLLEEFPIRASTHIIHDNWVNLDYTSMAYDEAIKSHPIVCECRGLLLDMETLIPVARGFDRFFNYGELNTNFNFSSSFTVYPKLDGSLIMLYYAHNHWRWKTRGSANAHGTLNVSNLEKGFLTFEDLCDGLLLVNGWDLHALPRQYTYMFELTSQYNPVVVRYKAPTLSLLAIRHTLSGQFVDHQDLVATAGKLFGEANVLQPIFVTNNIDEVTEYVNSLDGLQDEGVVLVDENNQRLKIKNAEWCKLHKKVWGITQRKAVELVIENDADIDEICVYFPDLKTVVEKTRRDLTIMYEKLYSEYEAIKDIPLQKDFALEVLNTHKEYSSIFFAFRKQLNKEKIMQMIGKKYLENYTEE